MKICEGASIPFVYILIKISEAVWPHLIEQQYEFTLPSGEYASSHT